MWSSRKISRIRRRISCAYRCTPVVEYARVELSCLRLCSPHRSVSGSPHSNFEGPSISPRIPSTEKCWNAAHNCYGTVLELIDHERCLREPAEPATSFDVRLPMEHCSGTIRPVRDGIHDDEGSGPLLEKPHEASGTSPFVTSPALPKSSNTLKWHLVHSRPAVASTNFPLRHNYFLIAVSHTLGHNLMTDVYLYRLRSFSPRVRRQQSRHVVLPSPALTRLSTLPLRLSPTTRALNNLL